MSKKLENTRLGGALLPSAYLSNYFNRVLGYQPADITSDIREQIDVQMATYMFEVRRQNELLEELRDLVGDIREKPGITEDEIFNAARKGVKSFQNRTKKNPWPVLA